MATGRARRHSDATGAGDILRNPWIPDTIGWIYYKAVYKTAEEYLKQCADRDQKNAKFQYQIGMVEWELGNRAEARRRLRNVLALDPGFADAQSAKATLA